MLFVRCLAVTALVTFMQVAVAQDSKQETPKADPTGTWKWDRDGTASTLKLRLQGGKVVGTYSGVASQGKEIKIENGKLQNGTVSFGFGSEINGTEVTLNFEGKVSDDGLEGSITIKADDQEFPLDWSAARTATMDDAVGLWKLKIPTDEQTFEPTLDVSVANKKLAATYITGDKATDMKLEGNLLSFKVDTDFNGANLKLHYKLRLRGNKAAGEVDANIDGNEFTLNVTGVREVGLTPKQVLGTWQLKLVTEQQTFEPTLAVSLKGEKLAATYITGDDAYDIKIDGDTLSLKLDTDFNGQDLKLHYKLNFNGDAVKGVVDGVLGETEFQLPVTGERTKK